MSRRSFYRHSARHSTTPFATEIDEPVTHWTRDWVTPSIDSESSAANGTSSQPTPLSITDQDSKSPLGFSIKMWVRLDGDYKRRPDGDDNDLLIFEEKVKEVEVVEPQPTEGGLTAADIRGAVGGEAIPGMTSSQYEPDKQETNGSAAPVSAVPTADPEPATLTVAETVSAAAPEFDAIGSAADSVTNNSETNTATDVAETAPAAVEENVQIEEQTEVPAEESNGQDVEMAEL